MVIKLQYIVVLIFRLFTQFISAILLELNELFCLLLYHFFIKFSLVNFDYEAVWFKGRFECNNQQHCLIGINW